MSDFILEILSEEIPASMQKNAAENFTKIAGEILAKNNLIFESSQIRSFITPRRLTICIYNLSSLQKTPVIRRIGPKINADKKAIAGFLKSVGLSTEAELQQIDNAGNLCYAYVKPESEIKTTKIIQNSLPQILQKMTTTWSKLMRWDIEKNNEQPRWIRPIRNIFCLFGDEIIDVEFAGLKSNNFTYGHFLKSSEALQITNSADYKKILEKNFVILDQEERKQKIIAQIRKIKLDFGLKLIDDEEKSALIDEVVGLCEFPTALLASIDEKFLELPNEILILTLKLNQKYFCLKDNKGSLVAKFIFISNAIIDEFNYKKIIAYNEKLVRARLNDAEFFIKEDLKKPLISRVGELKKIIFHQKLGSLYDKTLRLKNLAKFLSLFVPHCNLPLIEKAINLCKTDLTCKTVAELPELQGKMGSFYAIRQGEDKKIAAAIYEHYLPLGPNSELPKTSLGIVLSISDKIDSIVGFFLANEKPTSSKDPYALRRAALGIIRIGFQYNIAFPIRILIKKSLDTYPTKLVKNLLQENKKLLVEEIIKFFIERLKIYLKENEEVNPEIVNVVLGEYLSDLDLHQYCDILYLAKKIKFLDDFIKNKSNANIIELYKRSANILAIEEKKDKKSYNLNPSFLLLKNKYELVLYRRIKQIKSEFKKLVKKGEFEAAFKLLHIIEVPLEHFFDHVIVNDKKKNIRQNRLALLSTIKDLFTLVADLSKVEI